ncbi:unnamed protein product [Jaminaea pallidilutea]
MRFASSSRASRLASAAQASTSQLPLKPPPPAAPFSEWIQGQVGPDGMLQESEEEAIDPWTSSQDRLSPIGRLAKWQRVAGPHVLPRPFREGVDDLIRSGNRQLLKDDMRSTLSGELHEGSNIGKGSRASLLHLAINSPQRYATTRQVLATAAVRLGQASPDSQSGWSPSVVVDMGCGTGESAWAAAETWPSLQRWQGRDASGALLKTGSQLFDFNRDLEEPHPLSKVHTSIDKLSGPRVPVSEGDKTLALSTYQLLAMHSDSAREQHVKALWRSGAESIVLVEEGTDRGFAAIASARALLLELGEEERLTPQQRNVKDSQTGRARQKMNIGGVEFFEELPEDREEHGRADEEPQSAGRGCWVVAPCPHDKPCPLLHPFQLERPHEARPSDSASRRSDLHSATHLGLSSCVHPVRYLPPRWAREHISEARRRTRQRGGREERSHKVAYVIVKRGERPTFGRSVNESQPELLGAASDARRGVLDQLRKGDTVPRRLAEDVVGEEGTSMDAEDQDAQAELLKLLPSQLQQNLAESGGDKAEMDAALEQAMASMRGNKTGEDVMSASSDLAEAAASDGEAAAIDETQEQNEEWLAANLAQQADSEELSEFADASSESSSPSEVAAAMSLMLPSLPRIVLPPIKKGGHVTFDACHSNGSIQRYTVAKSAGKQAYQEVRKSGWGDLWSQDPVEQVLGQQDEDGLSPLEYTDPDTGRHKWVKRQGWSQLNRISPAAPERGLTDSAINGGTASSRTSANRPMSVRASNRPSAYIGADQVCQPERGTYSAQRQQAAEKAKKASRDTKAMKRAAREVRTKLSSYDWGSGGDEDGGR